MNNIKQYIIISFSLSLVICFLEFPSLVEAQLQSTTYKMNEYDFGSGGKLGNTSTTYSLYGNTGQFDTNTINSTTYTAQSGLTFQITTNVPGAPTVSNNSGQYYNKLNVTLNTSSNPTDTTYAIKVVSSSTQYVQADDTLGANPVFQTNATWGATGFNVVGLTPNTSYTVSSSAKAGTYTQSAYGPGTTVSTVSVTFSFSLNSNSLAFPALNPGTVAATSSTVTATVSTNGTTGATIYVFDANAGLRSTSTGYNIAAATANLSNVSEGYGLQDTAVGQTSGGPMEKISPYNGTANNVGILDSTNKRNMFDSTGAPVTSGTGTFQLMAIAGNNTKAETDYADTVTVIASASF